jgi:hypothetical protein
VTWENSAARRGRIDVQQSISAVRGVALRLALLFAGLAEVACTDPPPSEMICGDRSSLGATREPLNGGGAAASYLGLGPSELGAIVQVLALDENDRVLSACTGTLVTPTRILSALHCEPEGSVVFQVHRVNETGDVLHGVRATALARSNDFDLLVLEVPVGELASVTPIPFADRLPPDLVGQRVQLAGTGYAEGENPASRLFAVASVVSMSDTTITVTAGGYAGACDGDSGGPLLVRGAEGRPEVAGVLSAGSVNCWSEDDYVRTDAAARFLLAAVQAIPTEPSCGALDYEGRCFGNQAVWCEQPSLVAAECEGATTCGFDPDVSGYRCVEPRLDPCHGIDELGECRGGDAMTCEGGRAVRNACSQCGAECVISPRSGRATCVET